MICARCNKPITGTPAVHYNERPSGPPAPTYLCPTLCKAPPRQTAPTRRIRRKRGA